MKLQRGREGIGEYVGERNIQQRTDDDATRQLEIDTERDRDAVSIRERIMDNAEKNNKYDGKYKVGGGSRRTLAKVSQSCEASTYGLSFFFPPLSPFSPPLHRVWRDTLITQPAFGENTVLVTIR